MQLSRAGQPLALTLQEFKVLKFFVSRPEVVLSRTRLITAVWPKRERLSYRTVDNCIAKLRQKIEQNPAKPVHLLTVHGVGYRFVPSQKRDPFLTTELRDPYGLRARVNAPAEE